LKFENISDSYEKKKLFFNTINNASSKKNTFNNTMTIFLEILSILLYYIYKENNMFYFIWVDLFSFQKYPQLSIQITHIKNRKD